MYQQSKVDLTAVRGDTFLQDLQIFEQETGNPFNFTDWTAKMQVRKARLAKVEVELDSATPDEIVMTPGLVKLKKPAGSMDIEEGTYQYDIQFTNANSDVFTLVTGDFTITDDITHTNA